MLYKKPSGLKFTDLCIYIDQNVPKIANPGEYPEIESTVYNYLWLLVKALAIKKCMFNKFEDYDGYAFYAATRLFLALRKNYLNQGKVIKGKQIKPIKSCLNYTKALLYPMKIEYQNEAFREVISEEFVSKKFDAFAMKERMRAEARAKQGVDDQFKTFVQDSFKSIGSIIDKVLQRTPYRKDSIDYKHIRISLMLNTLNSLALKNKLNSEITTIILWKLPKSMASYIRVLLKELFAEIKLEIIDCNLRTTIDDNVLDRLMIASNEEYDSYEE
jgi:hypothetical protein